MALQESLCPGAFRRAGSATSASCAPRLSETLAPRRDKRRLGVTRYTRKPTAALRSWRAREIPARLTAGKTARLLLLADGGVHLAPPAHNADAYAAYKSGRDRNVRTSINGNERLPTACGRAYTFGTLTRL